MGSQGTTRPSGKADGRPLELAVGTQQTIEVHMDEVSEEFVEANSQPVHAL